MNRLKAFMFALAFVALGFAPVVSAANATNPPLQQTYQTPPICSSRGFCTSASVTGVLVPYDSTHPCKPRTDGQFDCTVTWALQISDGGLAGCGWGYMTPTGENLQCVFLAVGVSTSPTAQGSWTYTVASDTPAVTEPATVCADYRLNGFETCHEYPVPYELPALDSSSVRPAQIIAGAIETVQTFANAVQHALPL